MTVTYRMEPNTVLTSGDDKFGNFSIDKPLQVDPESIGTEAEKAENANLRRLYYRDPVQQWDGLWYSRHGRGLHHLAIWQPANLNDGPGHLLSPAGPGYAKAQTSTPRRRTVVGVFRPGGTGNAIVIDHGLGVYTIYMHLKEILVEQGAVVESGQLIGIIGTTGRSTGPHLHFE
jgi:murein DD-endopeptidase MepM/ murein hydrolase activator NlpD